MDNIPRGIAFVLLSIVFFVALDTTAKFMTGVLDPAQTPELTVDVESVEAVGGDLTIKVEDNTDDGLATSFPCCCCPC